MKGICKICGTALYDGFTVSLPVTDRGWLYRWLDKIIDSMFPCTHYWH